MDGRELRCTNGPTGENPVRMSDARVLSHAYVWVPILAPDTLFCPLHFSRDSRVHLLGILLRGARLSSAPMGFE
jgi:hypothetical protein